MSWMLQKYLLEIYLFINSSPPPLNARHSFGETQLVEVTEANAGLPVSKQFSELFRNGNLYLGVVDSIGMPCSLL